MVAKVGARTVNVLLAVSVTELIDDVPLSVVHRTTPTITFPAVVVELNVVAAVV